MIGINISHSHMNVFLYNILFKYLRVVCCLFYAMDTLFEEGNIWVMRAHSNVYLRHNHVSHIYSIWSFTTYDHFYFISIEVEHIHYIYHKQEEERRYLITLKYIFHSFLKRNPFPVYLSEYVRSEKSRFGLVSLVCF